MSEFDDLIDGYEGAPSSVGERRDDSAEVPGSTPGGLIDDEVPVEAPEYVVQDVVEMTREAWAEKGYPWPGENVAIVDEPPHEPGDWPEEEEQVVQGHLPGAVVEFDPSKETAEEALERAAVDLRALRPDQRPVVGQHYVIYEGVPMPVVRDQIGATEDEFVRSQMDVGGLKDPDGQRQARADRALRQRFRGYVCGEMASL